MPKRSEGDWEQAYKDLKYFVVHNLEGEALAKVRDEIQVIENHEPIKAKVQEKEKNFVMRCIKSEINFILDSYEKWIDKTSHGSEILRSEKESVLSGISSAIHYVGYKNESNIISDIVKKLIYKDLPAARELLEKLMDKE
ncbi:hypothetical protein [Candidatus Formimonas warabiya]|uniref:Uncharacterized protein n=1 Tax=Formimonas warabiya TaxID=1761012 RepID=A0A3G1KNT9_FORW1|nr:hypothetical protein [Candidatus Formimonas warabiya]ATW24128.1 hypothetical protein DCMF_04440 [Candidatus Formimonas warabiya]